MGRMKKGRKQDELLRKLEQEHSFDAAKELIEIYGYNKKILCYLAAKVHKNIDEGKSPLTDMTDDEIVMYNTVNKDVLNMLIRMLAYLYPKLRSLEVGGGTGDKIVFNISTLPQADGNKPLPAPVPSLNLPPAQQKAIPYVPAEPAENSK